MRIGLLVKFYFYIFNKKFLFKNIILKRINSIDTNSLILGMLFGSFLTILAKKIFGKFFEKKEKKVKIFLLNFFFVEFFFVEFLEFFFVEFSKFFFVEFYFLPLYHFLDNLDDNCL